MTDYYVDPVDGLDTNLGTSEGSGNAWKTLTHAAVSVAAGDTVWCKNNASYLEILTLSVFGSTNSEIMWVGYSSTPGDNGKAAIDAESTRLRCVYFSTNNLFNGFRNWIFKNATTDGVDFAGAADNCAFFNCDFRNNATGIDGDNNFMFRGCTFTGNTVRGYDVDNGARFIGCAVYNNGTGASQAVTPRVFFSYFEGAGSTYNVVVGVDVSVGCVFDGAGTTASCMLSPPTAGQVMHNIFLDATTGMGATTNRPAVYSGFWDNNLFWDVTNPYGTLGPEVSDTGQPGFQDVSPRDNDPKFTDRVNWDYTLQSDSPAINAGMTIGSYS
jgi:hypothetical protein